MKKAITILAVLAITGVAVQSHAALVATYSADAVVNSDGDGQDTHLSPTFEASDVIASDAVVSDTPGTNNVKDGIFGSRGAGTITWSITLSGGLDEIDRVVVNAFDGGGNANGRSESEFVLAYSTDGGVTYPEIATLPSITLFGPTTRPIDEAVSITGSTVDFRLTWDNGGSAFKWKGIGNTEETGADIQLYAVPEPATMSLLGLGGLVALRRRRRA
jgi:hypothetical protein